MSLQVKTYKVQSDLSAFCRNGEAIEIPGTKPEGLKQYRKLVFGVVKDAIENSFPIAIEYIQPEIWEEMVYTFFKNHKCRSFQVWNIAGEFYEYALKNNWAEQYKIPVLNDLLKFEWAETEMYNMKDIDPDIHTPFGDFLFDIPVFNPEFRLLQFTYPVHLMKPEIALEKPASYFVLVFRDLVKGRIHFVDLSVFNVWMIEQMAVYEKSLDQTLLTAKSVYGEINKNVAESAVGFLKYLNEKKFLLGFKPVNIKN